MAHIGIHRTCSESEYRAACLELDDLFGSIDGGPDERRVDELIELIERYDGAARFTLDFSDEPFASAA
jgi:hypothetical protein